MTDTVGRRIPKGYYIKIKKGTTKQQIKELLYTRFDSPDYDYDAIIDDIFSNCCYRHVAVRNSEQTYDWWEGLNLSNYKEFLCDDIGEL